MEEQKTLLYRDIYGQLVQVLVQPNQMGGLNFEVITTKDSVGRELLNELKISLSHLGLYLDNSGETAK